MQYKALHVVGRTNKREREVRASQLRDEIEEVQDRTSAAHFTEKPLSLPAM